MKKKIFLEFNNSYRPTFSIDPETNMSNTKMLIEVMLANNWIMKNFHIILKQIGVIIVITQK